MFPITYLVLLLAALVGTTVAKPMVQAGDLTHTTMNWTISNVTRERQTDNTVCNWYMTITDVSSTTLSSTTSDNPLPPSDATANATSTTTTTTTLTTCNFQVANPEGEDCGARSFGGVYCQDSDSDSDSSDTSFRVSGGHSEQGFVVMILEDEDKHAQGWFGFADLALDSGAAIAPQTVSVRPFNKKAKKRGAEDKQSLVMSEIAALGNGTAMLQVRGVERYLYPRTNTVFMNFYILPSNADLSYCVLILEAPNGTDLTKWEWYDQNCLDGGYFASWGYIPESDAGILTLVSPTRDSEAFFGFTNISSSPNLAPGGPSAILPCDCGTAPLID